MPSLVGVPLAMTAGWVWLGVGVLAWVAVGVGTAVVLERRGHDLRSLLGLAVVLGPLFVPLGFEFVRRREPAARPIHLDPVPPRTSGLHAIVAVLGAPESVVDALPVLASYGAVTAVTLARLVSRDHDLIVITGATEDVGAERLSDLVGVPVVVAPRLRERG